MATLSSENPTQASENNIAKQAEASISTKRKAADNSAADSGLPISFTSRKPPWSYLKLQLITQPTLSSSTPFDALTARTHLTSALSQFLGVSGTSISIDILKIETIPPGQNILWIRVPRDDSAAVVAAVSSWVGGGDQTGANVSWRIRAKGGFLGALVGGTGKELFGP
ncbi:ribonuclease P/MRP protein subunit POP8 [Blastomyces parvus]|uniref:Ribonuclease P/MRP protein subunit POP8 n=1 Tax=Blastomyces parvus TaxID=2060905 RepID=A0A2B7XHJ0_9EURO|nr:ribonuclease P/MRP protein subunit POP8 [Blastomyces parvus]